MTTASVVICTFNRPESLRKAVRTARQQTLRDGVIADIWVVDNSADANARANVAALMEEPGLPLHYLSAPRPNISNARNAGVAATSGDYVVFVDDDEWCRAAGIGRLRGRSRGAGRAAGSTLGNHSE